MALTEVGKEATFLTALVEEILPVSSHPAVVYCDNQGAIACIAQDSVSRKMRFIDLRCHFLRELEEDNVITINYIQTTEMLADVFTKGLPTPKHSLLCAGLGLVK